MDEIKVKQYFERIGMTMPETIVPDAELLKKLVFHNIISIPHQNTQFLTKKIIPCETEALYQRIVVEKKGGICHDVAGLFAWFLSELGYGVVQVGTTSFLEKIRSHIHKTLVVTDCSGTEWLAETAYTTSFNCKSPIRFVCDVEQHFGDETFRFEKRDGIICLISPNEEGSFRMERWNVSNALGTYIKEYTIAGSDPVGKPRRMFTMGTPEGRRTLYGNSYREYYGKEFHSHMCTPDTLPWAYAQFGLVYHPEEEVL